MSLDAIAESGLVAVIRAPSADAAVAAAEAVAQAGVRALEITFTTPGAAAAIARLADRGLLVGAGTVVEPRQAQEAHASGARFLVSPGVDDDVLGAMRATGLPTLAGVFTASEVMRARRLGASAVKLFPAGHGGVGLLRALREPFPDLRVVPTGGVTPENLGDWLAAGALAVGAGGAMCPQDAIREGRFEELRERAAGFVRALETARADSLVS
ncbi:MAG TPA: bifunctional 4-hydroxy-2-oxoglutarate aldolase/2-dehydro-3-deoxy-phosphogluconate aldolase [Baekduia sp.]|uniref:bifunctional 4-hydroxy-2-oxoglutarate aldolase/2-dehydro-3-deoxy-phosphogluconate aldolase n=1 Tax=Baekduia sp. TaxID=2600305 RepID=UPI002BD1A78F|nr:bifunctional 4-hydroxy-2-oxoglutarate aldolase/2-dehydro-3-deoxy-phosphogluconate aldolase [Baekduia sp.]HMJ34305.1 bifunctional 4-hydroxy-2-oxoglutarate aldolase/2-dehydro-3-deoxy-phosphogluconate aldolase [Baekduia sp.]